MPVPTSRQQQLDDARQKGGTPIDRVGRYLAGDGNYGLDQHIDAVVAEVANAGIDLQETLSKIAEVLGQHPDERVCYSFDRAMAHHLDIAMGIMFSKRRQRGHLNIERQGPMGVWTRVTQDKYARIDRVIKTLDLRTRMADAAIPQAVIDEYVPSPAIVTNDTAIDDIYDCINYLLILLCLIDSTWSHPLINPGEAR